MELRKATRQQSKLRVGFSGPSGSGKTYGAIVVGQVLASSPDKVAIIDTENGSADLYSHLGDFNVLPLQAPYTPERYIEAINACVKAGMEVIILDSVTHEWDGKGGLLESNELLGQTKFKGNNWAAWSVTTPRHQKFIEAITTAPVHILTTARSKTDTIQTEDKKIKKVGLKEIQREGFEYELTLNFTLDRDGHYATASKDRTGLFIDRDPFVINKQIGVELKHWAETGIDPAIAAQEAAQREKERKAEEDRIAALKEREQAFLRAKKEVFEVALSLGFKPTATERAALGLEIAAFIKATTNDTFAPDMNLEGMEEILAHLKLTKEDRANPGARAEALANSI